MTKVVEQTYHSYIHGQKLWPRKSAPRRASSACKILYQRVSLCFENMRMMSGEAARYAVRLSGVAIQKDLAIQA